MTAQTTKFHKGKLAALTDRGDEIKPQRLKYVDVSEGSCSPMLSRKRTEIDLKIQTPVLNLALSREFQRNSLRPTPKALEKPLKRNKSNSSQSLAKPVKPHQKHEPHVKKKSEYEACLRLSTNTLPTHNSRLSTNTLLPHNKDTIKENQKKSVSPGMTRVASREKTPSAKRSTPLRQLAQNYPSTLQIGSVLSKKDLDPKTLITPRAQVTQRLGSNAAKSKPWDNTTSGLQPLSKRDMIYR